MPTGSYVVIHLMMSLRSMFVFNHLFPTHYVFTYTSFSFTLPLGQLIFFFGIAHIITNIAPVWLDAQNHLQIES